VLQNTPKAVLNTPQGVFENTSKGVLKFGQKGVLN
jgi:hypothetical protein